MFQFFNMWASNADFMGTVQAIWGYQLSGTAQYIFCQKWKLLKADLKNLNREHFSHIQSRAEEARFYLESLHENLLADATNLIL